MDTPPYIQSVISSKDLSAKSAKKVLRMFLETQKKIFDEHETDAANQGENTEEYFNMEQQEDMLGYEEFEQRLSAMIESLSPNYYSKNYTKKKSTDAGSSRISIESVEPQQSSSAIQDESNSNLHKLIKEPENNEEPEQGCIDSSSASPSKSKSNSSKKETKLEKKKAKEAKKAKKKEEKESRKAIKREAKEAKKAEKEKLKKERKQKRKRVKEEEDVPSKKVRI